MSEFVFRNLSVKLFPERPADAPGAVCVCCSYDYECDACSLCTDEVTIDGCTPCTDQPTGPDCGPCTQEVTVCDPCTAGVTECEPCTGRITDDCFPCTEFRTSPCFGPFSHEPPDCDVDSCLDDTGCLDTITIVVPARAADVVRNELAVLRSELRQALRVAAEEERRAEVAATDDIEEIDQLRAALLSAVDELDERRAQLQRDRNRG